MGGMETKTEIFKSALSKVDVTFQNLDSSEISLTDVSHYFDSDPTKLVAGVREDGKMPSSFIADTTTANAQVRSLSETVRLDFRTKLLNPKWYEGMLASGYEGTREIPVYRLSGSKPRSPGIKSGVRVCLSAVASTVAEKMMMLMKKRGFTLSRPPLTSDGAFSPAAGRSGPM